MIVSMIRLECFVLLNMMWNVWIEIILLIFFIENGYKECKLIRDIG